MANLQIGTKIKYEKEVIMQVDGTAWTGSPFVRRDYHEDGSVSFYYGIEIDEEQFKELMTR